MPNNVNTVLPKTKNSMPSFTRGTLAHLQKAIQDGKVVGPAFHFLTEDNKKCLAFVDIDNTVYQINLDKINELKTRIDELSEGLVDPTSGEQISVATYVENNVAPVQTQVTNVTSEVDEIKQNGAAILITSKDLGGAE